MTKQERIDAHCTIVYSLQSLIARCQHEIELIEALKYDRIGRAKLPTVQAELRSAFKALEAARKVRGAI
jgi:hypothetical protein